MLITDLEQLEILSESAAIAGGLTPKVLSLSLTDQLVNLSLNNRPLIRKSLSNGEVLRTPFQADEVSGFLSALQQVNQNQAFQAVSLSGKTNGGGSFAFTSTAVTTNP